MLMATKKKIKERNAGKLFVGRVYYIVTYFINFRKIKNDI